MIFNTCSAYQLDIIEEKSLDVRVKEISCSWIRFIERLIVSAFKGNGIGLTIVDSLEDLCGKEQSAFLWLGRNVDRCFSGMISFLLVL
jgi:hypothetical protein